MEGVGDAREGASLGNVRNSKEPEGMGWKPMAVHTIGEGGAFNSQLWTLAHMYHVVASAILFTVDSKMAPRGFCKKPGKSEKDVFSSKIVWELVFKDLIGF